jgi:acetyl-CoA C-acetyltransferase
MKFRPREVAVIGGGVIAHAKGRPDLNITDMCVEAYNMAREDLTEQIGKPFSNAYIDALVVSYFCDHFAGQLLGEAMIADSLGLNPKRSYRAIGGGATGGIGVQNGYALIASGLADLVAVVGFEKMSLVDTAEGNEYIALASDTDWDFANGGYYTAYYAAMAAEYAKTFQIPVETFERQMAEVSVKNRKNAQSNPFAQTSWLNPWCVKDSKENVTGYITVDEVLQSDYCATPLRLRNCCLMSDGAAIVILASKETAQKLVDKPIWIIGTGMGTDTMRPGDRYDTVGGLHEYDLVLPHEDSVTQERYKKLRYPGQNSFRAGRMSAKQAYFMADIKSPLKELDTIEIHDAFSSSEIQTYEDLGLCPYGKGGEFVMSGAANIDGELPINPSGGLIGMGHSVGSSGAWQIYFTYLQLRGDIDKVFKKWNERFKPYNGNREIPRPVQIPNAKRGAGHSHAGTGSHVTYTILSNVEGDLERIRPLAGWESKLIRRPN